MINKISYLESNINNPYYNLALEEYLMKKVPKNTLIVFLWSNDNTVVIGKNQNVYAECNLNEITKQKAYIARRKSGGGAVYHDNENLNFSFICNKEDYNKNFNFNIIINSLEKLNIKAEISGRNDLTINGLKFSGNAFIEKGNTYLHHGTILFNINKEKMSKLLNVNRLKLETKKVKSVKSRVINLKEINNELDIIKFKQTLKHYLNDNFSMTLLNIPDNSEFKDIIANYMSKEFIYNKNSTFDAESTKLFDWGLVTIKYSIKNNFIKDIEIFTDSLITDVKDNIEKQLLEQNILKEINDNNIQINDVFNLIKYGESE